MDLPADSLKTLHKLVHGLAADSDSMLTTTEAADFLGVSRPYLTRLLKAARSPTARRATGTSSLPWRSASCART